MTMPLIAEAPIPAKKFTGQPNILMVAPQHNQAIFADLATKFTAANMALTVDSVTEIQQHIASQQALIGCPSNLFNATLLRQARQLKWVHHPGAGVENMLFPEFVASDIIFTNGRIIQGPECADHAIALLLSLTRRLKLLLTGHDKSRIDRPLELYRKNALVIAAGGIGLLIAERANALGMRVHVCSPEPVPMLRMIEQSFYPQQLLSVLPDMDVVFIAAPDTPRSHNMINAQAFVAMKKSAYLINISRGGLVDTDALVYALQQQQIAGAGLDVTHPEPLSDNHPLKSMDNVTLTPHIAGLSEHNRARSIAIIEENIRRFIDDMPLLNIVNKQLGY